MILTVISEQLILIKMTQSKMTQSEIKVNLSVSELKKDKNSELNENMSIHRIPSFHPNQAFIHQILDAQTEKIYIVAFYKMERQLSEGAFGTTYLVTKKIDIKKECEQWQIQDLSIMKSRTKQSSNNHNKTFVIKQIRFGQKIQQNIQEEGEIQQKVRKEPQNFSKKYLSFKKEAQIMDLFKYNFKQVKSRQRQKQGGDPNKGPKRIEDYFVKKHSHWVYPVKNKVNKQKGYLVLQYCQNGDLQAFRQRIKGADQNYSDSQILYIAHEVLMALAYFHKANFVHRDIKPKNILFDHQFNIKICDFGVSYKEQGYGFTKKEKTGTPQYMAPEQKNRYLLPRLHLVTNNTIRYDLLFNEIPRDRGNSFYYKLLDSPQDSAEGQLLKRLIRWMLKQNVEERKSAVDLLEEIDKSDISMQAIIESAPISLAKKSKCLKNISVERVFHLSKVGYLLLLSNQKVFIYHFKDRQCKEITSNFLLLVEDQTVASNSRPEFKNLLTQFTKVAQQKLLKLYLLFLQVHATDYFQSVRRIRLNENYLQNKKQQEVTLSSVQVMRQGVIAIKLSNQVLQFYFAKEKAIDGNLPFNLSISFNLFRSLAKKEKIVLFIQGVGEHREQFNSFMEGMKNSHASQHFKYIQKVLSIKLEQQIYKRMQQEGDRQTLIEKLKY